MFVLSILIWPFGIHSTRRDCRPAGSRLRILTFGQSISKGSQSASGRIRSRFSTFGSFSCQVPQKIPANPGSNYWLFPFTTHSALMATFCRSTKIWIWRHFFPPATPQLLGDTSSLHPINKHFEHFQMSSKPFKRFSASAAIIGRFNSSWARHQVPAVGLDCQFQHEKRVSLGSTFMIESHVPQTRRGGRN